MTLYVPNLEESNKFSTTFQGFIAAGYLIFAIAATIGNLCVFIINFRWRGGISKFKITSIFLLNLAVTDIGIAVGNLPFAFISICLNRWIFGKVFCVINGFIAVYLPVVSITTILIIAVHRAIVVLRPFKRIVTKKRAIAACVFSWMWPLIVPIPPLLGVSNYEYSPDRGFCRIEWVQSGVNITQSTTIADSYSLFSVSVFVIIPLCLISILNITLLLTSCRLNTAVATPMLQPSDSYKRKPSCASDQRAFKTVTLVVGAFALCWLPQVILVFMGISMKGKLKISPEVGTFQAILVMANSTMNPFIYIYVNHDFRARFCQILFCSTDKYSGISEYHLTAPAIRKKHDPRLETKQALIKNVAMF